MNKATIYLDKILADFLRAEFKSDSEIKLSTRNKIGSFIISLLKKSATRKEPVPIKNRVETTLIIPNVDGMNFDKYFLHFTKEDQITIHHYLRGIFYSKGAIWVAMAINSGHTAEFGILQFIHRHGIRNNAQNLEHLKKMLLRGEIYSFQKSLDRIEDAVNVHFKKFV